MPGYIYDDQHALTSFQLLFPDGEVKKACFLLSSVAHLSDHPFRRRHLEQLGLREGTDYCLVNVSELANVLPEHIRLRSNGPRIVLSHSGLNLLTIRARSEFGDSVAYWIVDVIIPAIERNGWVEISSIDPMLMELRAQVADLQLRVGEPVTTHVYGDIYTYPGSGADWIEAHHDEG